MNWSRSLQPWPWAGPGDIELLNRPIAAPHHVLIMTFPQRVNGTVLKGRGGIPSGWKRMDDRFGPSRDEFSIDTDGIDEDGHVEESDQPDERQRVNQSSAPRLVQGMVLSDREGRLYEKQDERVRLLGRVMKDVHGRLFECIPQGEYACVKHDADEDRETAIDNDPEGISLAKKNFKGWVPLFHGKPIKRIVQFGEVKGLLLSQVMEPNRLRDEHRLLCQVEIFEMTRSRSMESFASALLSETGIAGQLQLLTEAMMHKLQLTKVLPRSATLPSMGTRQPGMLLSGDRVFRLILVNDPTSNQGPVHPSNLKTSTGSKKLQDKVESSAEPLNHATSLKTSIPERFLKPWEFRLSREEALYDMGVQGRNSSLLNRFRGWRQNGEELSKWRVLLAGKELDEQLWGVRPPRNVFHHSEIREWAQRTLQQAGYNVGMMLPEWEVYWRRKGV